MSHCFSCGMDECCLCSTLEIEKPRIGCQNQIMPFGKYKGKDLLFIGQWNPKYIIWLRDVAELREPLKTAVASFSETRLFKDSLFDYEESERQYYDAVRDCWEEW
jgi:hypothetical protein